MIRRRGRIIVRVLFAFMACMVLIGCGGVPDDRASTLRINLGNEPPTLDWSLATDSTSFVVIMNIMEGLAEFDEGLNPRPNMARKWDVSPDGKRYVFHLRPDAVWTDGRPVTAEDYVYAWRRLLDPKTGSEYAYFLFDVEGAEDFNAGKNKDPESVGIRALSSTRLEVRLRKPVVFFPSLVTFPATFPLRRDVVEKHGDRWTEPGNIVTNGPFSLGRWEHEYKIEIVPNPRYFGPRPKLDRVRMFMVRDGATSLTLYETGDLDVTGLMPVAIPAYRSRPDFANNPVLRGNYVAFNVTKPPFTDPRVRRAFGHAIDRTQIPPILQGGEIATTSWIPIGMFGHERSIGLRFDPDRARTLLAEAGFPDGQKLPPVTMVYATDPTSRLLAENIQAQWKKNLNASVAIDNLEWKVFLSRLNADAPQIYRLGWGADYPDPDNFMALWTSTSGNNRTRWKNEAYDRLVARGTEEAEPNRRKTIYDEAQRILLEREAPIVPVYFSASNRLIHPRVRGFPANPLDLWILKQVSLEGR